MMTLSKVVFACASVLLVCAEWADTPLLSQLWSEIHGKDTDALIGSIVAHPDLLTHRAADGRGPLFWAYEFQNNDALALFNTLDDIKSARSFKDRSKMNPSQVFPGSSAELEAFEAQATRASASLKARVEKQRAQAMRIEQQWQAKAQPAADLVEPEVTPVTEDEEDDRKKEL
eukprot:c10609_g1_i3.p1 GENE.c10609_g1_i3~~c10609_g1_i3.p1  ORF type:complete len:173 (+),score=27.17 c10609_g1_i3:40-558(+)